MVFDSECFDVVNHAVGGMLANSNKHEQGHYGDFKYGHNLVNGFTEHHILATQQIGNITVDVTNYSQGIHKGCKY